MTLNDPIYGINTLEQWEIRRETGDRRAMRDLRDTKQTSGQSTAGVMDIITFDKLLEVVSFLNVMNKRWILLYRGQRRDFSLLPSLSRSHWSLERSLFSPVSLEGSKRDHYWRALEQVETLVLDVLNEFGLPRWRHLERRAPARWAVIQHYELWPTPLLDFTASLRVAATFALGFSEEKAQGYLYVAGVKRIRGDLMDMHEDEAPEKDLRTLAFRLNSVCPPSAVRPHLQEGVLVGHYPLASTKAAYDVAVHDASPLVIAKFRLIDDGNFWSDNFPRHRIGSLLPPVHHDDLLNRLRELVEYDQDSKGRIILN